MLRGRGEKDFKKLDVARVYHSFLDSVRVSLRAVEKENKKKKKKCVSHCR